MATLVVQALEIVEVENQHCLRLLARENLRTVVECFDQLAAVVEAGQRIGFAEFHKPALNVVHAEGDVAASHPDDGILALG
ncbi:MAG: hypothetical protein U5N27_05780 [Rhizobium sp.]|nr:hypothetical protein [Rhizobium sp.]